LLLWKALEDPERTRRWAGTIEEVVRAATELGYVLGPVAEFGDSSEWGFWSGVKLDDVQGTAGTGAI
jgi:hypothetical protein